VQFQNEGRRFVLILPFICLETSLRSYVKGEDSIQSSRSVFLNRQAAIRYRALASIIPGRERP